jgi:hypothetical protein
MGKLSRQTRRANERATRRVPRRQKFNMQSRLPWKEIMALLLAVASMGIDHTLFVACCLTAAVGFGCWGIATDFEIQYSSKILLCLVVIGGALGLFIYLRSANIEKALHQAEGILVPGNRSSPPDPCAIPPQAVALYLGKGAVLLEGAGIFNFSIGGEPFLSIEQKNFWRWPYLVIRKLKLLNSDGNALTDIGSNTYYVWPLARVKRTDFSTFTVFDNRDSEVLDIDYLNRKAIRLRGVFRTEQGIIANITDDHADIGNFHLQAGCIVGGGTINLVP